MYLNPINTILRIERDMTQGDLAKRIKISRAYVNRVINGGYDSSFVKIKIANALGKPVNELWPDKSRRKRGRSG